MCVRKKDFGTCFDFYTKKLELVPTLKFSNSGEYLCQTQNINSKTFSCT